MVVDFSVSCLSFLKVMLLTFMCIYIFLLVKEYYYSHQNQEKTFLDFYYFIKKKKKLISFLTFVYRIIFDLVMKEIHTYPTWKLNWLINQFLNTTSATQQSTAWYNAFFFLILEFLFRQKKKQLCNLHRLCCVGQDIGALMDPTPPSPPRQQ